MANKSGLLVVGFSRAFRNTDGTLRRLNDTINAFHRWGRPVLFVVTRWEQLHTDIHFHSGNDVFAMSNSPNALTGMSDEFYNVRRALSSIYIAGATQQAVDMGVRHVLAAGLGKPIVVGDACSPLYDDRHRQRGVKYVNSTQLL